MGRDKDGKDGTDGQRMGREWGMSQGWAKGGGGVKR